MACTRAQPRRRPMDRIDRIYRLHNLLRAHRAPVPFDRVRDELECDDRTVYRVIDTMRTRFDAPIDTVREAGYVYDRSSESGWELPGLWFTSDELQALLILNRHLEGLEPGLLSEQLEPLRRRLDRLMADRRLGAAGLAERVRFISIGHRRDTPRHFARIAEALLQRQALRIAYRARSTEEPTERTIDPQRLVHYRDAWYLDAWCRLREDLRMFSLDRIETCSTGAGRSADIDRDRLDGHYADAYGIFAGEATQTAVIRFTPAGARWAAAVEWHPKQDVRWLADGGYELRLPYARPDELLRDVLAYGPDAEILRPGELRKAIAERLDAALASYDFTHPAPTG